MFIDNDDSCCVESFVRIIDNELVLGVINLVGDRQSVSVNRIPDGTGTTQEGKSEYAQGGKLDLDLAPYEYVRITFY